MNCYSATPGYHGAVQVSDAEVHQFCNELRQAQRAEAEAIWRDFDAAVPGVVLGMELRPATVDDAVALWYLRNDPETRKAHRNPDIVPWMGYINWLMSAVESGRVELIAMKGGKPVGTVRFDPGDGESEISWTVAVAVRGQGIASEMVKLAVEQHQGPLYADIKPANIASQRVAAKCGFVEDGVHDMFQRWRRA